MSAYDVADSRPARLVAAEHSADRTLTYVEIVSRAHHDSYPAATMLFDDPDLVRTTLASTRAGVVSVAAGSKGYSAIAATWSLSRHSLPGSSGDRCAGETMSSEAMLVVEAWEQVGFEWVHRPEHIGPILDGGAT